MRTIPPSSARYATHATDARYDVNETALRDVGFIVGACDRARGGEPCTTRLI